MKKFINLLLSFCLCTGLILSTLCAVNATTSTFGSCGTNLSWTLSNNGALTVSGTGEMSDFTSSTMPWFSSRSKITSVIVEEGVSSVGNYAFYNCNNLKSIRISNTVTSMGEYAFANCSAITEIYYNGTEEQWAQIKLASRVFSLANYSRYIYYTGGSCGTNLIWSAANDILTISGEGDMKDWSYAPWYAYADEITSIIIGDEVTSIGANAFLGFNRLSSITIPKAVTKINAGAFRGCTSLTSINVDIDNADYSSPNGNLFNKNHTALIQYAIGKTAESYTVPEGVTNISDYAFEYCAALTDITIPKDVTAIGLHVFTNCDKLENIYVDEDNTHFSSPDGNLFDKEQTRLIYYAAGKPDTSYTVPDSVAAIEPHAFYNADKLSAISLPDSLLNIGNYAFAGCTNLSNIVLPPSVTSIGENAFQLCSNLNSVSVLANITSIEPYTFYNCSNLKNITLSNSITSIGKSAFYGCTFLNSITLPDKLTSINSSAFMYSGLTNIIIPNGVTSIGDQAFLSCTTLKDITIPNSVTSIGKSAFNGCTALSSLTLPNSITSIGSGIFLNCTGLKEIYYIGTKTQLAAISGLNYIPKNIALYYTSYQSDMTTIYYNGTTTKLRITPDPNYINRYIVCAFYENNALSDMKILTFSGNTLECGTTKPNDEIKIMVWKSLSSITPVCKPEIIDSSEW